MGLPKTLVLGTLALSASALVLKDALGSYSRRRQFSSAVAALSASPDSEEALAHLLDLLSADPDNLDRLREYGHLDTIVSLPLTPTVLQTLSAAFRHSAENRTHALTMARKTLISDLLNVIHQAQEAPGSAAAAAQCLAALCMHDGVRLVASTEGRHVQQAQASEREVVKVPVLAEDALGPAREARELDAVEALIDMLPAPEAIAALAVLGQDKITVRSMLASNIVSSLASITFSSVHNPVILPLIEEIPADSATGTTTLPSATSSSTFTWTDSPARRANLVKLVRNLALVDPSAVMPVVSRIMSPVLGKQLQSDNLEDLLVAAQLVFALFQRSGSMPPLRTTVAGLLAQSGVLRLLTRLMVLMHGQLSAYVEEALYHCMQEDVARGEVLQNLREVEPVVMMQRERQARQRQMLKEQLGDLPPEMLAQMGLM